MSTDAPKIEFWTTDPECEHLTATTIEEAIEEAADVEWPQPLPETVEVYGYAYMELPQPDHIAEDVLERLLGDLDGEYASPEMDTTEATPEMKAAALAFVRAVLEQYKPWACEQVEVRTVRVADYPEAAA